MGIPCRSVRGRAPLKAAAGAAREDIKTRLTAELLAEADKSSVHPADNPCPAEVGALYRLHPAADLNQYPALRSHRIRQCGAAGASQSLPALLKETDVQGSAGKMHRTAIPNYRISPMLVRASQ